MFSYDKDTKIVQMRHYFVHLTATGINKGVKKVLRRDKQVPNIINTLFYLYIPL